jgi:SpoIID/LytB domain protein
MRPKHAAVLALVLALGIVPAGAAAARTKVIIDGGGWGHGIGMSQYGAYGRALRGDSAEQILEHYYSGASVDKQSMGSIRVGLLQGRSQVGISSQPFTSGGGLIVFKVAGRPGRVAKGGPDAQFRVEPSRTGGMRIYKNGKLVKKDGHRVFGSAGTPLVLKFEIHDSLVTVSDKAYKYAYGRMEFQTYSSASCDKYCMRLVLILSMQKYVYGLGEVPSSWPDAALRTQAIAGRTYAFEKIRRLGQDRYPCGCAVYDSVIDQAYIGDSKRTGSGAYWDDWRKAVNSTKGLVVEYKGDPIQALYSSSSGGHTENNENVWGGTPLPYLRGVPDGPDAVDANPNHKWSLAMGWRAFKSRIENAYSVGDLQHVDFPRPYGVSGRITVVKPGGGGGVKVVGSRDTVRDSGWDFRAKLSLKDTLFRIHYKTRTTRGLRGAETAFGGGPGAAAAPAYHLFDRSGAATDLVQRFERGTIARDLTSHISTWTWGRDKFKWAPQSSEVVVSGPIADTIEGPCVTSSGPSRTTITKPSVSWTRATGLVVGCS